MKGGIFISVLSWSCWCNWSTAHMPCWLIILWTSLIVRMSWLNMVKSWSNQGGCPLVVEFGLECPGLRLRRRFLGERNSLCTCSLRLRIFLLHQFLSLGSIRARMQRMFRHSWYIWWCVRRLTCDVAAPVLLAITWGILEHLNVLPVFLKSSARNLIYPMALRSLTSFRCWFSLWAEMGPLCIGFAGVGPI